MLVKKLFKNLAFPSQKAQEDNVLSLKIHFNIFPKRLDG